MIKHGMLVLMVFAAGMALAQGNKSAAPAAGGPTKVEGEDTKTPDGLQYWDIKVGTGRTADRGTTVKVHYTGWLTNGKKFDSSVGKSPFQFRNPTKNANLTRKSQFISSDSRVWTSPSRSRAGRGIWGECGFPRLDYNERFSCVL
jgi:hypothetical protein